MSKLNGKVWQKNNLTQMPTLRVYQALITIIAISPGQPTQCKRILKQFRHSMPNTQYLHLLTGLGYVK